MPETEDKEQSEFGKGLCYCLGLFLCHTERYGPLSKELMGKETVAKYPALFRAEMWFNGASDHLYELQIESAPPELHERLATFRNKCLRWRNLLGGNGATEEDKAWAINEAKDLLLLIDKSNGVETEKGQWE